MTIRVRFVLSLVVCVASVLLLASAVSAQSNQDVTTWYYDTYRTGWQQHEQNLTPSGISTCNNPCFGLVAQWNGTALNPMGEVYAQLLGVGNLASVPNCSTNPCSLIFVADALDNVFAYDAASGSSTPVWSLNLAQKLSGTAVSCNSSVGKNFAPCQAGVIAGGNVGILGTPVIDTSVTPPTLYAAAAISAQNVIQYDLFASDIVHGAMRGNAMTIIGQVTPGQNPALTNNSNICVSSYPTSQTLSFDSNHIQRSALLPLNHWVYVAFAPSDSEWENGWILAYSFDGTNFHPQATFATTPFGTGGGIWGSSAGPGSHGMSIFTVTGNGTFDLQSGTPVDWGDSVLKLSTSLTVQDYFTPSDVYSYAEPRPPVGRCYNDVDLGSGGVLIFPEPFFQRNGKTLSLALTAGKESNIYVVDVNSMGNYVATGGSNFEGNNIETIQTPWTNNNQAYPQPLQGYWASPAYWKYQDSTTHYLLYYAATTKDNNPAVLPYPIYQYILQTSGAAGPITANTQNTDYKITSTLFCQYSPTPSVSSSGITPNTGILWAIEHRNQNNVDGGTGQNCAGNGQGAALHAFDAKGMNEVYSSTAMTTLLAPPTPFSTPIVFQSRVYMGTSNLGVGGPGQVYVFGLCATGPCVQPK